MGITSRRKRPLNRKIPHLRDTTLIIIATEGEKTEKQYFESDIFRGLRVQVYVLETREGLSAPSHVLKRLRRYAKEHDMQDNDQLWLMVDKDRTKEQHLSNVCSSAVRGHNQKIKLAISNPSFELWLYLHHDNWTAGAVSSNDIENALRKKIGSYNKSNLTISLFHDRVEVAVERAKSLDKTSIDHWPANPGTHVYRVVEEIQRLERKI